MPFADAFEKPFVHSAAPPSSSQAPMMAAPSVPQHGVTSARRAAPVAAPPPPQQSVSPFDGPVMNMNASENRPWSIDHSSDDVLPARRIW